MPARYLAVAEVGAPHGLAGEVALSVLTDFPERLAPGSTYLLSPPLADRAEVTLVELRGSGKIRARFEGIEDAEAAAALTGRRLVVASDQAVALDADTYYIDDLIGCIVWEADGDPLGELIEVARTGGANDVYVVRLEDGRELPIPAIKDVVVGVDVAGRRVTVRLIPGLKDLAHGGSSRPRGGE